MQWSIIWQWKELIIVYAATWMKLENITQSRSNQTQKATYCMILFIQNVQDGQMHRDSALINGCQGLWERGNEDWLLMGKTYILGVINTLELDSGDGSITLQIY